MIDVELYFENNCWELIGELIDGVLMMLYCKMIGYGFEVEEVDLLLFDFVFCFFVCLVDLDG